MDFIVKLPHSKGSNGILYDSIWVVVDCLSKKARFVPISESITAEQTCDLFIQHIFREHGAPKAIISDRGPQFAAKFWKEFHRLLGIEARLSTAFHPQTDGQTERVNQTLEQYLRCFIDFQQDNWVSLLPLAEFSYNNSFHTSIKSSPFFANYGFNPSFEFLDSDSSVPLANTKVKEMKEVQEELVKELEKAKESQKKFADRKRMDGPVFEIGDKVWLLRKNIKTQRPSIKLDHRKLGPYKIVERIGELAYRIKFTQPTTLHDVFHVSLLERFKENPFQNRTITPPEPDIIDDQEEFEVQEVLSSRIRNKRLEYKVSWVGYDSSADMWLPATELNNMTDAIMEFHRLYPNMPNAQTLRFSPRSRSKEGG
jgi:hypothetical protein